MAVYTPYQWADNPAGNTPITAARLNALEQALALVTGYVQSGVGTAPSSFSADSPPSAHAGAAYNYTFVANGSPAPIYTLASGSLPVGLTLSANGVLSGTPTVPGTATFTIAATNTAGTYTSGSTSITTTSVVIAPSSFSAASPPNATVGSSYSYSFIANGTSPSYAISSGSLPAGLQLSSSGLLAGVPTTNGTVTFAVTASNSAGSASTASMSIVTSTPQNQIIPPTSFALAAPPAATVGSSYSYSFLASGTSPTYTVATGVLPAGLTLSAGGLLSGVPTANGTSTFTVKATNAAGNISTNTLTIVTSAAGLQTATNLLSDAIASASGAASLFQAAPAAVGVTLVHSSVALSGNNSLSATIGSGGETKYYVQPIQALYTTGITAGTTYTALASYNPVGAGVMCSSQINWYDSNGVAVPATPYTKGTITSAPAGVWTQIAVIAVAPQGATQATIQLTVDDDPTSGTTLFDQLELAASASVTSWTAGTGPVITGPGAATAVAGSDNNNGGALVNFTPGATGGLPVTYQATLTVYSSGGGGGTAGTNALPAGSSDTSSGTSAFKTGATSGTAPALAADTSIYRTSSPSIAATAAGTIAYYVGPIAAMAVSGGQTVTGMVSMYSSTACTVAPQISWRSGPNSGYISNTTGPSHALAANTWVDLVLTTTVPTTSGIAYAQIQGNLVSNPAIGDVCHFDNFELAQGSPTAFSEGTG